jgi:hypothetical protein
MTIQLSPQTEERLKSEASRRGIEPAEFATQLIEQGLSTPNQATLDLLQKWRQQDATTDPAELARRQQEGEQFMENLARNRTEMEGPGARKLWP